MSEEKTSKENAVDSEVEIGNQKFHFKKVNYGVEGYGSEGYQLGFTHDDIAILALACGLPEFLYALAYRMRVSQESEV